MIEGLLIGGLVAVVVALYTITKTLASIHDLLAERLPEPPDEPDDDDFEP